ncbi:DUF418 domain-containing protein [Mangrovibacillus cuniculi]|uniref:DUF418 domain-containing protein n=1 Tax=Mangrovibacillus cuniculi TaxID=2593652 RepID=A0A7S8C9V3_9BACI|nr:DUF418 domain-containing protein [Mangrovibacillus cuniculi]QPC46032.1 DUF418 domain-containing protein [Mangrovibacillus cuniculi]
MNNTRIEVVDQLRGFALLGIFLVNMLSFHSPIQYIEPFTWWEGSEYWTYSFIQVFFQASMYPLFALLFGFGIAMMVERLRDKESPYKLIMTRRITFLLFIGLVHGWFIWSGDILFTYALLGILLLLFIKKSYAFLRNFALTLWGVTTSFMILGAVSLFFIEDYSEFLDVNSVTNSIAAYKYGTWMEIFTQRMTDWWQTNSPGMLLLQLILLLPIVLMGASIMKSKLLIREDIKWGFWASVFWLMGVVLKSLPVWMDNKMAMMLIAVYVGGPILTAAYISTFKWLQNFSWSIKILKPFATAGKMSLSIYLSQSIIATLIFYSYGLGLYDGVSLATGSWLALGIFAIQVIVAYFILLKYKQGPMERLWRLATYLK